MRWEFLQDAAHIAAPLLLGSQLITERNGQVTIGRIVEVEAYSQKDPASHTFNGETPRNKVMFGPAGYAYVYVSYGLHTCVNIVTGQKGDGEAVLIRAIEPMTGLEIMWHRRYGYDMPDNVRPLQLHNLTNGPGKLTKALDITLNDGATNLLRPDSALRIELPSPNEQLEIFNSRRIGITKGVQTPWRFYLQSPWVSRAPSPVAVGWRPA